MVAILRKEYGVNERNTSIDAVQHIGF